MSYRPARQHSLAELVPWNRFLGSLKVYNSGTGRLNRKKNRKIGRIYLKGKFGDHRYRKQENSRVEAESNKLFVKETKITTIWLYVQISCLNLHGGGGVAGTECRRKIRLIKKAMQNVII